MNYFLQLNEQKHEEQNHIYCIGKDRSGVKGYMSIEVDDTSIQSVGIAKMIMFEAILLTFIEAPSSEEALKYMYQERPLTQPEKPKYPLDELYYIRWSAFDDENSPREYCDNIQKAGGKVLVWDPEPIGDCILMLIHLAGEFIEPPKYHKGEYSHTLFEKSIIIEDFPEYVKE